MATFQISESVEINRPAETVFQYVTDIARSSLWRPHVSIRDISDEPLAVGTSWNEVSKFMGRDMVVYNEVTGLEAGRVCEVKMDAGVVSGNTIWNISPATGDSCTATLSFDGEISGWLASLAAGLLRNQAEKDMKKDLASLKSNLESG